ncbi:NACHT domain-containing protein [Brasilonema sp. CT11]|nr:NACHT domain-containing protein [Brasilonema sp. CT11]
MDKIKILFLAADPNDTVRLLLDRELRDIREKLQLAKFRERFVLESREAVRPGDITQAIFDVEPQIVHFSGHGTNTGEICFENDAGKVHYVKPEALAVVFELIAEQVKCVILNTCYSKTQAEAIAQHIPYVIGMYREIGDRAAITFATGFYKALGANRTVEQAYRFGCSEIQLENIPEHSTPILYSKRTEVLPKKSHFTVESFSTKDDLRSVDTLVPQVQERVADDIGYIEQVGTMRMFRINHPVPVTDVYVNLNILKQISSDDFSFSNRDRSDDNSTWWSLDRQGLGSTKQKEVPALETIRAYRKLIVLGKPGAGKTTLLKSLATACIYKNLGWNDSDYVPVFIELRKFAEDAAKHKELKHEEFSLYDAIQKLFKQWKVAPEDCKRILEEGRALILLDGLDEIPTNHSDFVAWQVSHFCQDFARNRFIITCRTQGIQYCFDSFAVVEIANFTREQACKFVHDWFTAMVGNSEETKELEQSLNTQLLINKPVGELAATPILLNLICCMFWARQGDLPTKRSELYDQCLKGLLEGEWDQSRGIQRGSELPLEEKEKLLAQIAYTLFENNDYLPHQRKLEKLIANYLQTQRSEAKYILKLLESQHGLLIQRSTQYFSFSHLTFHEFFTAKYIVSNPNPQEVFLCLVTHITESRWREVFLLTVEMLDDADNLLHLLQLMKCQIDRLLENDDKLQQFLCWVEEKSFSVKTSHNPAVIRAFYFDIGFDLAQIFTACRALSCAVNHNFDRGRDLAANPFNSNFGLTLFPDMNLDDSLASIFINTCDFGTDRINVDSIFDRATDCNVNSNMQCELKQLKDQLSDFYHKNSENFKQWWQENSQAWVEKLRSVMINHRNIGHDWKFSESQKQLLRQYYDANKQLVDCLNSDCCISLKVLREIENTLLLPTIRNISSKSYYA